MSERTHPQIPAEPATAEALDLSAVSLENVRVLVVDDQADVLLGLKTLAGSTGAQVRAADRGDEALRLCRDWRPHLVVSDIMMPGRNGMELLTAVREELPQTRVILITGFGTIDLAVSAMQQGASHFLAKPFGNAELVAAIRRHAAEAHLEEEIRTLAAQAAESGDIPQLVGESQAMRELLELIEQVAPSDAAVLIEGESGTGKELVARAIHRRSSRADKPFLAVNTAAMPESLLESELFGHKKGAFTGATEARQGLFREVDGGTVFLDEVASMPAPFQGKLLRVLQEKLVTPVGTSKPQPVDFRLITATNRNLKQLVAEESFREDLYYRLQVVPVVVPSLRERMSDVPLLAQHFLARIGFEAGMRAEAVQALMNHDWPGNVRELENTMQRAAILAAGRPIEPSHLGLSAPPSSSSSSSPSPRTSPSRSSTCANVAPAELNVPSLEVDDTTNYEEAKRKAVERFQQQFICRALTRTQGNVSKAAQQCGMTRAAFQRIMRALNLSREDFLP